MQYLKTTVRKRILDSAKDEFIECGYADASIRNIANNADVSLGNIYRYFENKENLYQVIVEPLYEGIKCEIEENDVFSSHSMKEICDFLVGFLIKYSDEIIIVRKSDEEHHNKFFDYVVGVTSAKIHNLLVVSFPEISEKIHDDLFYTALAEGFLTTLFRVLRAENSKEVQERSAREVITFFFGHLVDRFYHFDIN